MKLAFSNNLRDDFLGVPALKRDFTRASRHAGFDFISRDSRTVIEFMTNAHGLRDFHHAIVSLAASLVENPKVIRAGLIVSGSALSNSRLRSEWQRASRALDPKLVRRMTLAAIDEHGIVIEPEEPSLRRIATALAPRLTRSKAVPAERGSSLVAPTWRFSELVKILISRWLLKLGPISVGGLARQVGCTYPTARQTIARLKDAGVLAHHSNRAVELSRFPTEVWRELLVVSRGLRRGYRYVDSSGRPATPQDLLKRFRRLNLPNIALGGVMAARHWHPQFDLNGTPRLDLVYHVPHGKSVDLGFIARLDPALTPVEGRSRAASLVVHLLVRSESLFTKGDKDETLWADPVETAFDLNELQLDAQANQMFTHLRSEARLS